MWWVLFRKASVDYLEWMGESWASSEGARRTMIANRRRDTQPELRVRRLLHAAGLRYTVDARPVPTLRARADMVFSRRQIVIFIDGCFWHGCPSHGVLPKSNAAYWGPKLARNRERDAQVTADLTVLGWTVLRFWEHESPERVAEAVIATWRKWDDSLGQHVMPKSAHEVLH